MPEPAELRHWDLDAVNPDAIVQLRPHGHHQGWGEALRLKAFIQTSVHDLCGALQHESLLRVDGHPTTKTATVLCLMRSPDPWAGDPMWFCVPRCLRAARISSRVARTCRLEYSLSPASLHGPATRMTEPSLTRINKYLSEVGYCSRRAADKLIQSRRVTINGKVPEMGTKVAPGDEVRVDGKRVSAPREAPVYLAFNKPSRRHRVYDGYPGRTR